MNDGFGWLREVLLAFGMIAVLFGSLVLMTGSTPPMVVVESQSMMTSDESQIGVIDPGDIILVTATDRRTIVTYVEAIEEGSPVEGHSVHGLPGDVIIFSKNGGLDTPVIHRAILFAKANQTVAPLNGICEEGVLDELLLGPDGIVGACILTWDVPGTEVRNVTSINLALPGYSCHSHGHLVVSDWVPHHEGYLTTGDNLRSNGCTLDQYIATGDDSHFSGLRDENGLPVTAVRPIWVSGIAGPEVPWFGIVKLAASSNASEVTTDAWMNLGTAVVVLILAVLIGEQLVARILQSAPEYADSDNQSEENRQDKNPYEEE
ncbi:MAG: S26 family signal peptidase [Candidatus Thermoplasmatota archaeon]|nr:S26 family signal peptidase [Candidatus Thermoplasmatota archaeon]